MFNSILNKIENFCQILSLPGGLRAKLTEPSYNRTDLALCHRLSRAGLQPKSIVDVGANVGQFALSAALTWPGVPIYSFEPIPEAFAQLKKTAETHRQIQPQNLALGDAVGTARLQVTNQNQSSSFLPLHQQHKENYPDIRTVQEIEVGVSTLAAQQGLWQGAAPRLLKLDVQGFEAQVLRGGFSCLADFTWILLETSTRPMYEGETVFADLSELLSQAGFRFLSPVHIHFSSTGAIGQFDAIFVKS